MTKTLGEALLAAQKAMPKLEKDAQNPHYKTKFVSLDNLLGSVVPVLNDNGLVVTQSPTVHELGAPALRTTIIHAATGESVTDVMMLLAPKDDPQGQGSAITYARRYALMSLLGLSGDVDDDGQASKKTAQGKAAAGAAAKQTPRAAAPATDSAKGYATADQRRLLFDLKKANGVSDERLREILMQVTGQEATAQIPVDKFEAVLAELGTLEVPF